MTYKFDVLSPGFKYTVSTFCPNEIFQSNSTTKKKLNLFMMLDMLGGNVRGLPQFGKLLLIKGTKFSYDCKANK